LGAVLVKIGKFLAAICYAFVVTLPSYAGDGLATGLKSFNLRDYTAAMLRLSEEAREGTGIAQELVGQFYMDGHAAPKDAYEALYWFQKAGKNAENDQRVAKLEADGFTLPATNGEVFKLYLRQAENGDAAAAYRLASVYSYGRGVKQNFASAFEWYLYAAERGHKYAQFQVGRCYYNGEGTAKDMDLALEWVKKSADNGVTLAKYHYAEFLRTGVSGNTDPAEARKYYAEAANDGYGLAQFELVQFLLPEAKDFESRVEVLKWTLLYANHFDQVEAQKAILASVLKMGDVQLEELTVAQKRAKAFVRRNG
jgi:TPR repeat protein